MRKYNKIIKDIYEEFDNLNTKNKVVITYYQMLFHNIKINNILFNENVAYIKSISSESFFILFNKVPKVIITISWNSVRIEINRKIINCFVSIGDLFRWLNIPEERLEKILFTVI